MNITRRSKLERLIDILKVIANKGPIRQTHIMYKANLTWNELKEDLQWLKNLELIEKTAMREGIFFKITSTGLDTLLHFDKIETVLRLNYENDLSGIQRSRPYMTKR
ncbi:MAG: hypothetical protein L6M37_01925 [Candidatus Methylarchaceae archaeon HK02M1]|nr:hypothetical protein [Candidatus Methylarchaceae archaeon HK02M1]